MRIQRNIEAQCIIVKIKGGERGSRMEELNGGYVQMLAEISSTKCNIDTDKESSSRFLGLV